MDPQDQEDSVAPRHPPAPPPGYDLVVDAVVEGGVIRPLRPLDLPEGATLQLRIRAQITAEVTTPPRIEQAQGEATPTRDAAAPPEARAPAPAPQSAPASNGRAHRQPALPLAARWHSLGAWLDKGRPALVIVALVLATLAQLTFHEDLAFSGAGFGLALGGALLFALASLNQRPEPPRPPEEALRAAVDLTSPLRLSGLALVVSGSAGLLYVLRSEPPPPSLAWTLPVWALLIALFCVTVLPIGALRRPRRPGRLGVVALGIFGVALLARVWDVGTLPATLSGDEGRFGTEVMKVLRGEISNPFSTGWLSVPTMTFFYNAPPVALLGNTIFALRLPWVLMGALNVLTVFWLATRLQGPAIGIITACLLAVYHYHIHYSRLGLNNIADPFFTALTLLLLYRAYDRRSAADWVLCGVATGVSQYFYFGARLIVIVVVASIGCLVLRDGRRFWQQHGRGLALGTAAGLVTAAPIIQYAFRFPDIYNARVNQTGIFQSGWLANEVTVRGESAWQILLDQFIRAALAFNAYPDRSVWYGLSGPLLDLFSGALLLLGLGYAAARLLSPRVFPMFAWLGGALLFGGMLTESPPSSQRLITAAVPAVFFIALAIVAGAEALTQLAARPTWQRVVHYGLAGSVVVAFGIGSLYAYFVDYTPRRIYGSYNGIISTSLGHYANERLGPEWRIYFLGQPAMSFDFGSNLYLAPETEGVDIPEPQGSGVDLAAVTPDKSAVFVVLPFREGELAAIREQYPGGELERVPSPIADEPLYFVYTVRRERLGAVTP